MILSCIHTYIQTYRHTCMYAYVPPYACIQHTYMHACIHTYVHACMRAYLSHTRILTYTRTPVPTHTAAPAARAGGVCASAIRRRYTPLHYAAEEGQYDVVRLLVANGADVNARRVRTREGSVEYSRVLPVHLWFGEAVRGTAGGARLGPFIIEGAILGVDVRTATDRAAQRLVALTAHCVVLRTHSAMPTQPHSQRFQAVGPSQAHAAGCGQRQGRVRRGRQSASGCNRSIRTSGRCPRGTAHPREPMTPGAWRCRPRGPTSP
jgi:hypothetical protein